MDKINRIKSSIAPIVSLTDEELSVFRDSIEVKTLQKYPEILQKVPLYHIANCLGIAPKSLSRIRSELFSK
jgi:hypothetical protein